MKSRLRLKIEKLKARLQTSFNMFFSTPWDGFDTLILIMAVLCLSLAVFAFWFVLTNWPK